MPLLEPFSLANSCCGFAKKSGRGGESSILRTQKQYWCNPAVIDTPFSDIAFDEGKRTPEQIKANGETVRKITEIVYS